MSLPLKPFFLIILLQTMWFGNAQKKNQEIIIEVSDDEKLLEQAFKYLDSEKDNETYRISLEVFKRTKNDQVKAFAYNLLGIYHNSKYAIDSSLFYTQKAIDLVRNKKDSLSLRSIAFSYLTLSNVYQNKNLILESKKWCLKGISALQAYPDLNMLNKLRSNLAVTYRLLGDVPKAIEILESTFDYKDDTDLTNSNFISLGLCYTDQKNYSKALFYLKKPLDYYTKTKKNRIKAITLMNIGVVYLNMNNSNEAQNYFNKALILAKKHNYPLIELNCILNICDILEEKNEIQQAREGYIHVLAKAKESGYLKQQIYIYDRLKAMALNENNYKEALGFTERKEKVKDSADAMQKDKEISKLEVAYETLKKDKEIVVLKKNEELKVLEIKKQKLQKEILIYVFILIFIALTGIVFIFYQKSKTQNLFTIKQKKIADQKIEALIRDQELQLIKASISGQDKEKKRISQNLHDRIGGNLAAIKLQFGSAIENRQALDVIYQQLDETYEQVRTLSHELIPKQFKHNDFLRLLTEYMKNIGKASNLETNISTYPENKINALEHELQNEIFSIFQELITNTIKHASAHRIDLQIDIIENEIHIIFEDDGIGFDLNKVSTGIGLKNIKDRIHQMSGTMAVDSYIKRGTIMNVTIPVRSENFII